MSKTFTIFYHYNNNQPTNQPAQQTKKKRFKNLIFIRCFINIYYNAPQCWMTSETEIKNEEREKKSPEKKISIKSKKKMWKKL